MRPYLLLVIVAVLSTAQGYFQSLESHSFNDLGLMLQNLMKGRALLQT